MNWFFNNISQIGTLLGAHVAIALPVIALSAVLSVPLGWVAYRRRKLGSPLVAGLELLYAIPSLALFVLIPALFGVGIRSYANILIVLTIYGVAVLVRSSKEAFASVPSDIKSAADASGFSTLKRFWAVELPLAMPVYLAGVRVMAVSTISLVTVGSVIGIQSLGTLFTDGFQRGIVEEVLCGLVFTVVLALIVDAVLVLLGKMFMPWTKVRS